MTLRIEKNNFYSEGGRLAPWLGDEKATFESTVNAALELICSTEVGSSLLRAIEDASKEVLIVKAAGKVGNKCAQPDQGVPACAAACYTEVLNPGEDYVETLDWKGNPRNFL
jgi:hypothetical protein